MKFLTIIGITLATADRSIDDSLNSDISGRSSSSGSVSSGSGSSGLLGGVGNAVGGVVNAMPQTVGRVTARRDNLPTTLPELSNARAAEFKFPLRPTLCAAGDNLRLEKGVRFQLRLSESV